MFKIVIVLKKLIFMDNYGILYDLFTLPFCWNLPVWIKTFYSRFIIWYLKVNMHDFDIKWRQQ